MCGGGRGKIRSLLLRATATLVFPLSFLSAFFPFLFLENEAAAAHSPGFFGMLGNVDNCCKLTDARRKTSFSRTRKRLWGTCRKVPSCKASYMDGDASVSRDIPKMDAAKLYVPSTWQLTVQYKPYILERRITAQKFSFLKKQTATAKVNANLFHC